jgi:hypothetical protein
MKKSKLISLLETFNSSEWERFKSFLRAEYFNKNKSALELYYYLYDRKEELCKVNKSDACKEISTNIPFSQAKLAYTISDLFQLAEQFLSVERFLSDSIKHKSTALEIYSERNLQKHYRYLYNTLSEELELEKYSSESLLAGYQLNKVALVHFTKRKVRKYDPSIMESYLSLNSFYYLSLLKNICTILSWRGVVSGELSTSEVSMKLIEALLEKIDDQAPLIQIYLIIYQLYDTGNPQNAERFNKMMALVDEYREEIEKGEMREVYLAAINFGVREIRRGNTEYISPVLRIYDESIESGYLFEDNYLSHWTYTNVIRLGLQSNRFEWTEQFMYKYRELLPPEFKDDAFNLNFADLLFNTEKYDDVLEHLLQLTFSDPSYQLASRIILIKTFYEQGNIESLLSALASFSVYLKRNKTISNAYKKTCLNFCGLLNQIMRNNPKKRAQVQEKIKTTQPLAERAWLLKVWEEQGKKAY